MHLICYLIVSDLKLNIIMIENYLKFVAGFSLLY